MHGTWVHTRARLLLVLDFRRKRSRSNASGQAPPKKAGRVKKRRIHVMKNGPTMTSIHPDGNIYVVDVGAANATWGFAGEDEAKQSYTSAWCYRSTGSTPRSPLETDICTRQHPSLSVAI